MMVIFLDWLLQIVGVGIMIIIQDRRQEENNNGLELLCVVFYVPFFDFFDIMSSCRCSRRRCAHAVAGLHVVPPLLPDLVWLQQQETHYNSIWSSLISHDGRTIPDDNDVDPIINSRPTILGTVGTAKILPLWTCHGWFFDFDTNRTSSPIKIINLILTQY